MSVMRVVGIGLAVAVSIPLFFWVEAHVEMRRLADPLPSDDEIVSFARGVGEAGPVRIGWVESGRQKRSDGGTSITGSYVLEWADGRLFAIDVGMSESGMTAFAATMEDVMGAEPGRSFGSLGQLLGASASRLGGIGFTHLHEDHTEGAVELCGARGNAELAVYQTAAQFSFSNYLTTPGLDALEASGCARPVQLAGEGGLLPIPGFPGLAAFSANGHTPGSTVFVARVGKRLVLMAGDITNVHANLMNDIPKGAVYSYLIVPESTGRLGVLRRKLAGLHLRAGVDVLVAHDPAGQDAASVFAWEAAGASPR